MRKLNKKIWWLLIPLALSLWGINYGLPLHLIGDEESIIGGAMKMLELQNIIPATSPEQFAFLYYPAVIPYLEIIAFLPLLIVKLLAHGFKITQAQADLVLNMNSLWLSARILSALAATVVVYLTYKLAAILYNQRIAWLAATFIATSWYHILLAHFTRHWVFSAIAVYLIILVTLYFVKGKTNKDWLIGLVSGLAVATSYLSILGLMAAILIIIGTRHSWKQASDIIIRNVLLFLLVGGVLVAFNWPDFARLFVGDLAVNTVDKSFNNLIEHFYNFVIVLWNQETVLVILTLASLFVFTKHSKLNTFIWSSVVFYIIFLYYFVHFENRYVYLVLPALALLAAQPLYYLGYYLRSSVLKVVLLLLVLSWPLVSAGRYLYLLSVPDTRLLAIGYIESNLTNDFFLLSSPTISLNRDNNTLSVASQYGQINARERFILANYEKLSADLGQTYQYQNIHFWNSAGLTTEQIDNYLERTKPTYFVLEYWNKADITESAQYLLGKGELVTEFSQSDLDRTYDINGNFSSFNNILFNLERLGPNVAIYQLKYE